MIDWKLEESLQEWSQHLVVRYTTLTVATAVVATTLTVLLNPTGESEKIRALLTTPSYGRSLHSSDRVLGDCRRSTTRVFGFFGFGQAHGESTYTGYVVDAEIDRGYIFRTSTAHMEAHFGQAWSNHSTSKPTIWNNAPRISGRRKEGPGHLLPAAVGVARSV